MSLVLLLACADGLVSERPALTWAEPAADPKLLVSLSFHVEGWSVENEGSYRGLRAALRRVADAGERYDARFSFESKELTTAAVAHDDELFAQLVRRGHAVGVHADLWGRAKDDQEAAVEILLEERLMLEELGVSSSFVSGVCGELDWVEAAVEAGFTTASGLTTWCLTQLDVKLQPPRFQDCRNPKACHGAFPGPERALRPWRTDETRTWTVEVVDGPLLLLPNATGLRCNAEYAVDPNATSCDFDASDLEVYFDGLDAALERVGPEELGVFGAVWSIGPEPDEELFDLWLAELDVYVQAGVVRWATVPEIEAALQVP